MREFNSVLIVEDDELACKLAKHLILKNGITENVKVCYNGQRALAYLSTLNEEAMPEFILVDINMPIMGGERFLQEYQKLKLDQIKKSEIYILSTSDLEKDVVWIKSNKLINGLISKPLSREKLEKILA